MTRAARAAAGGCTRLGASAAILVIRQLAPMTLSMPPVGALPRFSVAALFVRVPPQSSPCLVSAIDPCRLCGRRHQSAFQAWPHPWTYLYRPSAIQAMTTRQVLDECGVLRRQQLEVCCEFVRRRSWQRVHAEHRRCARVCNRPIPDMSCPCFRPTAGGRTALAYSPFLLARAMTLLL